MSKRTDRDRDIKLTYAGDLHPGDIVRPVGDDGEFNVIFRTEEENTEVTLHFETGVWELRSTDKVEHFIGDDPRNRPHVWVVAIDCFTRDFTQETSVHATEELATAHLRDFWEVEGLRGPIPSDDDIVQGVCDQGYIVLFDRFEIKGA